MADADTFRNHALSMPKATTTKHYILQPQDMICMRICKVYCSDSIYMAKLTTQVIERDSLVPSEGPVWNTTILQNSDGLFWKVEISYKFGANFT